MPKAKTVVRHRMSARRRIESLCQFDLFGSPVFRGTREACPDDRATGRHPDQSSWSAFSMMCMTRP